MKRKKHRPETFEKEVFKITSQIVRGYNPEKIILFGSRASGKVQKGSDIDLLIIKDTNERYWDRVRKVIDSFDSWHPVDLFVLTPQELDRAISENRFMLTEEILPKGKVLYEKKPSLPG